MKPLSSRAPIVIADAPAALIAVVGVTLLWLRPTVTAATSSADRLAVLATITVAIAAASLLVPVERDPAIAGRGIVSVMGLVAIGLAWAMAGPTATIPFASGAVALSLVTAVAEEALFRRLLYARLRPAGAVVAIVVSAALFALVHLPAYGPAALPVDMGAGLLFGWQRWASGTWTVPAATHAAANLLAVMR